MHARCVLLRGENWREIELPYRTCFAGIVDDRTERGALLVEGVLERVDTLRCLGKTIGVFGVALTYTGRYVKSAFDNYTEISQALCNTMLTTGA